MTKNLLLSAAALGALVLAGAATAGEITTTTPRTVASETAIPTGGFAGTISTGTDLTTDITLPAGQTATYSVTYELQGGTFDSSAPPAVSANATGGTPDGLSGTVYLQSATKALAIFTVQNTHATDPSVIDSFSISGKVKVAAKNDVKISSVVSVNSGGVNFDIDTAAAATLVNFKPFVKGLEADGYTLTAALPDYKEFVGGSTAAYLADSIKITANTGSFFAGISGGSALSLTDVIGAVDVTASGPAGAQLDALDVEIGGEAPLAANVSDTAAKVTLASPSLANSNLVGGSGIDLWIDTGSTVALNGVKYSVTATPTYKTGFAGVTTLSTVDAGEVVLEGTNFTAPWMVLNNANNTATLRLANNGTTATGPVYVQLTAHNASGAVASTRKVVRTSIAAGQAVEILGSEIATLLGSTAQNGDVRVTIEADGSVISGKVRVRNTSGATFEQTLGNLEAAK